MSRDLAEQGYDVTGAEPAPTLLQAAKDAHVRLPLPYNNLMDIDDLDGAMREFAGWPSVAG